MKSAVFLLVLLTVLANIVKCSRILVVFPMAARSHYILGSSLARILAEAGHDVTMVSPFEEKTPPMKGKYRDVVLSGFTEERDKQRNFNFFDLEHMNPFLNIPLMDYFGNMITRKTLEHPNFQKLMKSNEHFDVVILQQFTNDALKVLAYHFKAPLILFSTIGASAWINPLVGNPSSPSYIPDVFMKYTSNMTFWQRLVNSLFIFTAELNRHFIFFPKQNRMMKEHFPDAPDLSILNYNASLVLINSHESTNQPVPRVPNMIDIGGFHVNPPKELQQDLKEFMDNAKEGVVYFSMGSNIKPSEMSAEKKKAIVNALAKIKEKVLWKWDEDTLPEKPSNVKISKWFPQQDLLAHPNMKLFITHGGLLSTTETVYHGVPILALPIAGDQKMNAARAEMSGYGIALSFSEITEEKLSGVLHELLHNPTYRENAKMRSKLLHDRPMKPKDVAVFWTEFVIRHNGAPHLRVAALDLPWYQYLLLDVILFIVLVSIGLIFVLFVVVRKICSAICRRKEKVKTS